MRGQLSTAVPLLQVAAVRYHALQWGCAGAQRGRAARYGAERDRSPPAPHPLPCAALHPRREEDAGSSGVVTAGDNSYSPSAQHFRTCLHTSS